MLRSIAYPLKALLSLVLVTVFTTACTTTPPKQPKIALKHKNIAVAAFFAQKLNLVWIGTTPLNNESKSVDISAFNMNQLISDYAIQTLRESNRFGKVISLPIWQPGSIYQEAWLLNHQIDYILLLEPGIETRRNKASWARTNGLAIIQTSAFGFNKRTDGQVAIRATLINAKTGKSVRSFNRIDHWKPGFTLSSPLHLTLGQEQVVADHSIPVAKYVTHDILLETNLLKWLGEDDDDDDNPYEF